MAVSRRHFLFGALLAGAVPRAGFGSAPSLKFLGYQSPNEKLNIAGIGAGGRALQVLNGCTTENIVALADVDWARGEEGFTRFPGATKYKDYRRMLDAQGKGIDAVVIAIPDHMHATAALACMQLGKGVYVEKPLTRTPWEARLLAHAAQRYKVATQMGNQGYSAEATRVAAEIIWSGEIGDVKEVHAWHGRPGWPQGMTEIPPPEKVPDTLDWDLWLGGAAARPYTSGGEAYKTSHNTQFGFYQPFNWRGFYDFGSGLIGDWGIHILGPANWALRLGAPVSVEGLKKDAKSPFTLPDNIVLKYEFAARRSMPPVTIYWYDNVQGDAYMPPGMTADEMRPIPDKGPQVAGPAGPGRGEFGRGRAGAPGAPGAPGQAGRGRGRGGQGPQGSGYNCVFVGSKGYLGTRGRGEGVGLIPGARWAEYSLPPQMLTRSPGHQRDWIRACKGGDAACSHFGIAGPYTEWMLLGMVATRVDGKLLWDSAKMEFTNNREANKYVRPVFRKGWELKMLT